MKLRKLGVVLLALLLAAMAMAPMVSAVEQEKGSLHPTLDIRNIQLPELQFDSTQTKILVTTELRLDPNVSDSSVAAVRESSELIDAKIPYGSIIYHSDDGITTVFDPAGRQLFSADDKITAKIETSGKEKPATYFHEVPSGSMILSDPEKPDTTYVVDTNNNLVLTVIDKSQNSYLPQDSRSRMATQNIVQCNPAGRCAGWFEYAEDNYIPELTRFEAYWATPGRPLTNNMGEKIAIFNSIQPSVLCCTNHNEL